MTDSSSNYLTELYIEQQLHSMGVPADDWVAKASAPDAKSWERTLLKHYQLITLVKGDEASSTVLALQTSNTASYDDLDKDHKDALKDTGLSATTSIQSNGSGSYDELDAAKAKSKTTEDWEEVLNKGEQEAIKRTDDTIHAAYEQAHGTIGRLPSNQQDPATDFWNSISSKYTQAWSTIASGYNGLYKKAREFVKKAYTAIETFGKTVISACKKAWDWIKGFF